MDQFGYFLKRSRECAGLSQEQLAEKMSVSLTAVQKWESGKSKIRLDKIPDLAFILNISIDTIMKEVMSDIDKKRKNSFPDFLFTEQENKFFSTLHLNLKQQELFGLLCIFWEEFKNDKYDNDPMIELQAIPYQFINEVGSIQLMNITDGLLYVLKYVRKSFLLKVLSIAPDSEFDILTLPKPLICEFLESGYRIPDEEWEDDRRLNIDINFTKAKEILPILKEKSSVYLTDILPKQPCVKDMRLVKGLPNEFYKPYQGVKSEYVCQLTCGLETVTSLEIDDTQRAVWKINEKGEKLCQWFNEKE